MDQITLNSDLYGDALCIPMKAVDRCLNEANESQLKIYLYLLKNRGQNITVTQIADYFNYTEQDVKRAIRFWGKKSTKTVGEGNVVEFAQRPVYTNEKLAEFAQNAEVRQLLIMAEQYLGRPLKQDDISSIVYLFDELGFPEELIEFLMEYCISNNKKSFRSIEAVAKEWKEAGITSVGEAKRMTRKVPDEMGEVIAALGLPKDHSPIDAEIGFVRKWTQIYGYGMDIIKIACERTVLTTGKPSFKYANSIIKGWYDAKVKTVSDILALDEDFKKRKLNENAPRKTVSGKSSDKGAKSSGKFHDFSERDIDFALLEDILSNTN